MRTNYVLPNRPVARLLLLISVFVVYQAAAQSTDTHLIVLGEAIEEVPANQASLNVTLTFSDEKDVTLVYEQHKVARERLMTMLNELKVPGKDIETLQLLIRKERDFSMPGSGMGPPVEKLKGLQRIIVKFDDLKRYAAVQQHLASNGFNDLASVFSVSNQREIELRLVEQAVANAKEKADRLAKAVARSVKRVVRIGEAEEAESVGNARVTSYNPYATNFATDPNRPVATIQQLYRFSSIVKVVYELN